jgi:hypothetical protein
MDSHDRMILTGEKQRTQRETCPSANLFTTNPTWTDPGLCSDRPVANRTSHIMGIYMFLEIKVMEVPELISDGWLHDCACLVDWTTHKNELNLKL